MLDSDTKPLLPSWSMRAGKINMDPGPPSGQWLQ